MQFGSSEELELARLSAYKILILIRDCHQHGPHTMGSCCLVKEPVFL
jgi:hypothetical protein